MSIFEEAEKFSMDLLESVGSADASCSDKNFIKAKDGGKSSGFGSNMLWNKISLEKPTLAFYGEERYLTPLWVSGKGYELYESDPSQDGFELSAGNIDQYKQIIHDKIRAALKLLTFREQHVLVQFWSPCVIGKHRLLTSIDQPFGLGVIDERLLLYRKDSVHNSFVVDKDDEDEDTSPIARVFRRGLPEWTSDVTSYLPKYFPQQECAIRCNLHGYLALPVLNLTTGSRVGVIELLTPSKHPSFAYEVQQFQRALKKHFGIYNLNSIALSLTFCAKNFSKSCFSLELLSGRCLLIQLPNEYDKIHGILKSVCDYHNLPLAQTWAVSPSTSFVSHNKNIKKSCSSFGTKCIGKVCMSTVALPYYVKDIGMWKFMEECRKRHMYKSEGVVGRASSSHGVFVCRDVTELNEVGYPPMCGNKVKSCFAVSLHPVAGDDVYVLEFFLPVGTNDRRFVKDVVKTLKIEIASDFVLSDKSSMDLSDSSDSEESSVTDVSKSTCSANDPETESSTNVSMENRHAAIYIDDGETSSPFIQGIKKRRQYCNPYLY